MTDQKIWPYRGPMPELHTEQKFQKQNFHIKTNQPTNRQTDKQIDQTTDRPTKQLTDRQTDQPTERHLPYRSSMTELHTEQ